MFCPPCGLYLGYICAINVIWVHSFIFWPKYAQISCAFEALLPQEGVKPSFLRLIYTIPLHSLHLLHLLKKELHTEMYGYVACMLSPQVGTEMAASVPMKYQR